MIRSSFQQSPLLDPTGEDLAVKIYVNDKERRVPISATLLNLLGELGLVERRGVAVAINDTVVARTAWPMRILAEGDRVLVIQATQGG